MRTVDKSKKANVKCEYCEHLNCPEGDVYHNCTCKLTGKLKNYWNRCKQFQWRTRLNYKREQTPNERVIADTLIKGEKEIWDLNPEDPGNQAFNRKIIAVNNMYAWLYKQGILKNVSFEFRDYSRATYFAVDVADLIQHRPAMEKSGIEDAGLAVHHIFDEVYTPCEYSGAIELGWTMRGYRDFGGTVSRSWECNLCKHLNSVGVLDVYEVKKANGVKEAVKLMFKLLEFKPSDLKTE